LNPIIFVSKKYNSVILLHCRLCNDLVIPRSIQGKKVITRSRP
jgi:hypothetical protein